MRDGMRPWPHKRHVAGNHIQKLRNFVEIRTPEKPSNGSHPAVVAFRLTDDVSVVHRGHGPEFKDAKLALVEPVSTLPE